jgi:hypothetical protein
MSYGPKRVARKLRLPVASRLWQRETGEDYPGGFDEPMPTRGEFEEALQYAQAICDFMLSRAAGWRQRNAP